MRTRYWLGAAAALGVALGSLGAQAQWFPLSGGPGTFYIGVEGGYTALTDATGNIGGFSVKERFSDGYNFGGRVGVESGPWRLEEEFRFQHNTPNALSINGLATPKRSGASATTSTRHWPWTSTTAIWRQPTRPSQPQSVAHFRAPDTNRSTSHTIWL